ncbi:hypothetical protein ACQE3E_20490 [Methylomonas sp. MED-D]|nr:MULTISPECIES: hypothetical protein [Methylomonas]MDT4332175.1 hypothetical protein [Methylomonas sp. MV1]
MLRSLAYQLSVFMSEIILFPVPDRQQKSELDAVIDDALKAIPKNDREKLRFELIKTIDGFDTFFTEWSLSLPEDSDETLRKQIYDIAHQEHDRKMRMLKEIMRLKIKVLVAEYRQRK